jgi:hypothetical protein
MGYAVKYQPRRPSPPIPAAHGLWSLWDMLEENAKDFMNLGHALYDVTVVFGFDETTVVNALTQERSLNEKGEIAVRDELRKLAAIAKRLNLPVSAKVVERSMAWADSTPQTLKEFDKIVDIFKDEIGSRKCLFLPQHLEQYYEWDGILSDEAITAFPKASEEIREAGTCLAAGANTACVFHAMRAAEIGLMSLAIDCKLTIKGGKPIEIAEWREILDALSTHVHSVENQPNSVPTKDADLLFYSESSAQFRFFKNGWRIRAAHARASYSEPQAKEALDHVRSFFEILAPRLKEST